jgi:hypothetical protein
MHRCHRRSRDKATGLDRKQCDYDLCCECAKDTKPSDDHAFAGSAGGSANVIEHASRREPVHRVFPVEEAQKPQWATNEINVASGAVSAAANELGGQLDEGGATEPTVIDLTDDDALPTASPAPAMPSASMQYDRTAKKAEEDEMAKKEAEQEKAKQEAEEQKMRHNRSPAQSSSLSSKRKGAASNQFDEQPCQKKCNAM